jgi:hypothetical protein
MRSVSAATAFAALIGSAGLAVGVAAGTAMADTTGNLGITSFGSVTVDGLHHEVFVSDPSGGQIVVTDYSGTVLRRISGLPGVDGLALSADSKTLYAAVGGADEIAAVDTTVAAGALAVSATYPLGTVDGMGVDATQLAVDGSRIWFGYRTTQGKVSFGSLDLGDGGAQVTPDQSTATTPGYGAPRLIIPASSSGQLVVVYADQTWGDGVVDTFDTSSGTPVPEQSLGVQKAAQVQLSADGKDYLDSFLGLEEYPLDGSGARVRKYADSDTYSAIAVAPDGTVAASENAEVYTFPLEDNGNPPSDHSVGGTVQPGGVVWSPDSADLFSVVQEASGSGYGLHTETAPREYPTFVNLSAPSSATRNKSLTIGGRLGADLAVPVGTPLTVTRTDLTSPKGKTLPEVKTTDSDGSFRVKDTPTTGGDVTYKVSYAGDATYSPSSKSVSVSVSRSTPSLTLSGNHAVHSYGAHVTFTAHLGSTYSSSARTLKIYANPYGSDKPNKLVKEGKVNSKGDLSVTLTLTRDTTVEATYAGDAHYKPETAKVTAYDKVKVSTKVTKDYKKARIGSHTYYWFHKKTAPIVTSTMTYYKGRKARYDLQEYYEGTWYELNHGYFKISSKGTVSVNLGAPGEAGIKARVRASYENGSSGDNVNTTTHGSWEYLYFSS